MVRQGASLKMEKTMTRVLISTVGLFAITGCGSGPVSGDYEVTATLVSDSCAMFEDETFEVEVWSVLFNDDGSVAFTFEDDSEMDCLMSGSTAACEISASEDMEGMDATLITEAAWNLSWEDSDTSFTGSQEVNWSCTGDCDALGEFIDLPCDASADLSGVLAE